MRDKINFSDNLSSQTNTWSKAGLHLFENVARG